MSSPGFRELVFSDLARVRPGARPSMLQVLVRSVTMPSLLASVLVRAQQALTESGRVRAANAVHALTLTLTGADITPGARIGRGLWLAHPVGVVIGNHAVIGDGVSFAGGATIGSRDPDGVGDDHATIGDGVLLSTHAVVLGRVTVGRNALVAANAVVLSDVPDDAVVAGSPATVVGTRSTARD